jgi:hypothetical protein
VPAAGEILGGRQSGRVNPALQVLALVAMRIQSLAGTAAQAVNTAIARGASSYPSLDMARDGYVRT